MCFLHVLHHLLAKMLYYLLCAAMHYCLVRWNINIRLCCLIEKIEMRHPVVFTVYGGKLFGKIHHSHVFV